MISVGTAIRAVLVADATVASVSGSRVYIGELPKEQADSMPRKAIVVSFAGGSGEGDNDYLSTVAQRVDIFNYGETYAEAEEVQRATHDVMKLLDTDLTTGRLLHNARRRGGVRTFREPPGDWPVMLETWDILAKLIC